MKKTILIILVLITPLLTICQPWLYKYDLSEWTLQETWTFNKDNDKGYLLNLEVCNFSPVYDQHSLIIKVDDNGQHLYELKIGDGPDDCSYVENVRQRVHGMLMIAGVHFGHPPKGNPFILILDSCNQKLLCTLLDNCPHNSFFIDGLMLLDSSIIALSMYNDADYNRPIFIHKFNKFGEQLWRKELASMDLHPDIWNPDVYKLMQLSSGDFLVSGLCYWPDTVPNSPQYIRMMLIRADSDGNETGFYVHGTNDNIHSYAQSSVEYNGKIYTGGAQYQVTGYSAPHLYVNQINCELIQDANIQISNVGQRSALYQVILTQYSGFGFFGALEMYLPNSDDEGVPAVVKLDTNGIVSDFFMHPDTTLSSFTFPELTRDNKVILAGGYGAPTAFYKFLYQMRLLTDTLRLDSISWSNYNYDTLCPDSIINQTIPIDNCLIVVNNDDFNPPLQNYHLEMIPFPVPASGSINIRYSNTLLFRNIWVKCFSALGKLVNEFSVNSGTDSSVSDISLWKSGLYIAVAFSNGTQIGSCKFIVH